MLVNMFKKNAARLKLLAQNTLKFVYPLEHSIEWNLILATVLIVLLFFLFYSLT